MLSLWFLVASRAIYSIKKKERKKTGLLCALFQGSKFSILILASGFAFPQLFVFLNQLICSLLLSSLFPPCDFLFHAIPPRHIFSAEFTVGPISQQLFIFSLILLSQLSHIYFAFVYRTISRRTRKLDQADEIYSKT